MEVIMLTKPGCARCLLAKPKLSLLGVSFVEEQATLDRLKSVGLTEKDIPGFIIDSIGFTYPAAMLELKDRTSE